MTGARRSPSEIGTILAAALVSAGAVVAGLGDLRQASNWDEVGQVLWVLAAPAFLMSAALIVARQPRNSVGWILAVPGLAIVLDWWFAHTGSNVEPPVDVGFAAVALLWAQNIGWTLLIFPLFHLLLVFPTGRAISERWRWLIRVEVGMLTVFWVLIAVSEELGSVESPGEWSVANPIGFVSEGFFSSPWFGIPWLLGLLVLMIGGVASIVTRFRRGTPVEHQQLKLLLYAVVFFATLYGLFALGEDWQSPQSSPGGAIDQRIAAEILFVVSVCSIPVAIAVSVLRYRLFDIDYLIRRTVTYAVVVASLGIAFAGSVAAFATFLPSDEPLVIAASTLVSAALFNPVLRRVRRVIDLRFNRSRYDHEEVMTDFAGSLRNRVDADGVMSGWTSVVERTMQPSAIGIWIRP